MEWKGNFAGESIEDGFSRVVESKIFVGNNQGVTTSSSSATVVSELTIPANTFQAGDIVKIRGILELTNFTSGDPNTIEVKWQGKNLVGGSYADFMASGAVTPVTTTGAGHSWYVDVDMQIRSIVGSTMTQGIAGSMTLIQDTKVRQDVGQCAFHTFTSTRADQDTLYCMEINCSDADTPVVMVDWYATLLRP